MLSKIVLVLGTMGATRLVSADEARGRRPMLWTQIKGTGGRWLATRITTLAKFYGEYGLEPATPTWTLGTRSWEYGFGGTRRTWPASCVERARLFEQQARASWTAISRPLEASDLGCDFDYGVTVAEPVATMVSTIAKAKIDSDGLFTKSLTGVDTLRAPGFDVT